MRRHFTAGFGFAVIILALAGCSSGYSSDSNDYSQDLAEMKERILELQEKATVADVEIARLRSQVATLERRLAGETGTTGSGSVAGSDASPQREPVLEAGEPDPVIMVEVEESDLDSPPTSATAEEVVAVAVPATTTDSSSESSEIATTGPPAQPETASESPQIVSPAQSSNFEPVDAAGQALYDRGYTLYHQGRYLDAEASFQRFLQANPSTELSDNAQFWIGESRYARGDIRGALAAFRETLQRYPDGNKVPDAMIKEGDCLASLGDRDGARSRYEEVIRRFGSSAAAIMAEERLAALD